MCRMLAHVAASLLPAAQRKAEGLPATTEEGTRLYRDALVWFVDSSPDEQKELLQDYIESAPHDR